MMACSNLGFCDKAANSDSLHVTKNLIEAELLKRIIVKSRQSVASSNKQKCKRKTSRWNILYCR